jgi:hypothetical protein
MSDRDISMPVNPYYERFSAKANPFLQFGRTPRLVDNAINNVFGIDNAINKKIC